MAFKIPQSVLVVVHTRGSTCCCWSGRRSRGLWQSVTGSREPDDPDLSATARRELLEETALSLGTLTDWRLTNRYEIWPHGARAMRPRSPTIPSTSSVSGADSPTVATLDPAEHVAQLWLPWQGSDGQGCFRPQIAKRSASCPEGR